MESLERNVPDTLDILSLLQEEGEKEGERRIKPYVSTNIFSKSLTHFHSTFHFYTPLKNQKTSGFLMISGGIEMENWLKMGKIFCYLQQCRQHCTMFELLICLCIFFFFQVVLFAQI